MKKFYEFLKTTAMGGLFALFPILLFAMLLTEALNLMVALATPIAELFPDSWFDRLTDPTVVALVLILGASFLFGLALRSSRLVGLGKWFDETVLDRIPFYQGIKRLAGGLAGRDCESVFKSGVMTNLDDTKCLVYIVENPGNGLMTIIRPSAPTGLNGPLSIVSADRVRPISASVGDVSAAISQWGVGLQRFLEED